MAYTSEQKANIRKLKRAARMQGASPRETKALLEAAAVESGFRHLNYGDRDSRGILQQRPSQGWGPAGESVEQDAKQFLTAARKLSRDGYKGSAGRLAQGVQRSGYPERYDERSAEVERLLASGARGAAASSSGRERTYQPGVDNSQQRQALKLAYLESRGRPGGLLDLQAGLDQAQDTPGRMVYGPAKSSAKPKARSSAKVRELFWQGPGGINVKNGKRVPQGFVSGHRDHVHVATDSPRETIELGRLAKRMGLRVGENPAFGGVSPVHTDDSYHYKKRAIDVSGDPKKMAAYARRVTKRYGI